MNVNVSEQKPLEWNWYCLYYVRNLEFTFEPLNIYCHLDCTLKIKDPIHLTLSTQVQKLCSNQSKCIFIILNSSSLKHVTLSILFIEHSITIVQTIFIHIYQGYKISRQNSSLNIIISCEFITLSRPNSYRIVIIWTNNKTLLQQTQKENTRDLKELLYYDR